MKLSNYEILSRGGQERAIKLYEGEEERPRYLCSSPKMLLKLKGYLLMIFWNNLGVCLSHSKRLSERNPLTTITVRSLSFSQSPFVSWLYRTSPQLVILNLGCTADHLVSRQHPRPVKISGCWTQRIFFKALWLIPMCCLDWETRPYLTKDCPNLSPCLPVPFMVPPGIYIKTPLSIFSVFLEHHLLP